MRGVLSLIYVLLEDTIHTCVEIEWCRKGDAP
jgi:hypothetical protein